MGTVRTDEFRKAAVRIALSSKDQKMIRGIIFPEDGLSRQQIADDLLAGRRLPSIAVRLGVGMSTLNTWITAHRETDAVSPEDRELALENERLRRENRILREERDILKCSRARKGPSGAFSRRNATYYPAGDYEVICREGSSSRAKSHDGTARQGFAWQTTRGFRFVEEHVGAFPTDRLCRVVNVSPRGLRAYPQPPGQLPVQPQAAHGYGGSGPHQGAVASEPRQLWPPEDDRRTEGGRWQRMFTYARGGALGC